VLSYKGVDADDVARCGTDTSKGSYS